MQIDLSNLPNIVSKHFYPLLANKKKYLLLQGGIASGKSAFAIQKLVYRILTDGIQHRILIVRKVSDKLRNSVFAEFISVLKDMGLISYANITTSPMQIELFGSVVLFSGIDDPEKIKSISRISMIAIDELSELSEKDFDELADRLRTDYPTYKQIIGCFNPVGGQQHWLYKKFYENDDLKNDTYIDKSTYLDNDFINKEQFGKSIKARYLRNPASYSVKVLGEWTDEKTDGGFYSSFNPGINTSPNANYNPLLPIITSHDFNVLPTSAAVICQISGKTLTVIDEIALKHPLNRPVNVVRELKRRYPNHVTGIYVTGDASGRANSTRTAHGVNDYTIIFNELKDYVGVRDFTPSANPNIFQRGEYINAIFAGEVEGVNVIINERCETLIQDLLNVKRAEDGTKLKKRIRDKATQQTYEPWAHHSDCLDIAICQFLKEDFKKFLKGGDLLISVGSPYLSNNVY